MKEKFNAVLFEENGWQIAQCVEIDLASQGNTKDEAFANLQEAMRLNLQYPRATIERAFAASAAEALSRISSNDSDLREFECE
ncbi:MAG: hypothetical protein K2X27_12030 [Candidatus Obscuribacterales bacterium]|nr:hypothetical protein [Candidatus Obscuribacterales bacterium]